ncbi:MAG: hypothetical protein HY460_00945 [Parcubacteria group bacterium]|nr:hypothetical protein [Parcubacteria group bacterium]
MYDQQNVHTSWFAHTLARTRGASSILFSLIILSLVLAALYVISYIAWRQLRASRGTTTGNQAAQIAESAKECGLAKFFRGDALTGDTLAALEACKNVAQPAGGTAEISVAGIGFSSAGGVIFPQALITKGHDRAEAYEHTQRAQTDIPCQIVKESFPAFFPAPHSSDTVILHGAAQSEEGVGFIDADNDETYSEGDTLLKPSNLVSMLYNKTVPNRIVFFPDVVVDLPNSPSNVRTIRSSVGITVQGALAKKNSYLTLNAPVIKLDGGSIITKDDIELIADSIITGDDKTVLVALEDLSMEDSSDGAGQIDMSGSCLLAGKDIDIDMDSRVTLKETNMLARNDITIESNFSGVILAGVAPVRSYIQADDDVEILAKRDGIFAPLQQIQKDGNLILRWDVDDKTCDAPDSETNKANKTCNTPGKFSCPALCP